MIRKAGTILVRYKGMKNKTNKMRKINVLGLFDGMSCGQAALERAGIKVGNYYASEIDKYAMEIAGKNYPTTKQLGDVLNWKDWKLPKIDLLIGGSPCQGFSFAGKQLNFDDPRSKLFFEYVNVLKKVKPKYFLLENVKMKKESQDIITGLLGVEPLELNSNLLSSQNRKRLYWTNIPGVKQPRDKGILLRDILQRESEVEIKYYMTGAQMERLQNSGVNQNKKIKILYHRRGYRKNSQVFDPAGQTECLDTGQGGGRTAYVSVNGAIRKLTPIEYERSQTLSDNYTGGVSDTQRYKMIGNGWTIDVISHILKNIKRLEIK